MNALKKAALFCALFLVSIAAFGQTAVSGSRVVDNNGNTLASGQWCFGATCLTVTSGAFSGTVTPSTSTVTVTDGGSNTYLTIPSVTIGSSAFNWDGYVVGMTASISGMGKPRIACTPGATYTQTDAPTLVQLWNCASNPLGQAIWINTKQAHPLPAGYYASSGVPTFSCTIPCSYQRTDVAQFYALSGTTLGQTGNTWTLIAPPSVTFASDLSGSNTSQTVVGIEGKPIAAVPTLPGQTYQFNGATFVPRFPVINSGTTIIAFGDSVCNYTGSTSNATAWYSLFVNAVSSGAATNDCASGQLISDVANGTMYRGGGSPGAMSWPSYSSKLTLIEAGINDARQNNALQAPFETAYQQYMYAALYAAAIPTQQMIQPYNSSLTITGSTTVDVYYTAFPGLNMPTGATVSFPITTYGAPIYLATRVFPSDTGTLTVTIDGTVATDTVTGLTTYPNSPVSGTINQASTYPSAVAGARYSIAAGTHTVLITCTAGGTNGCEFMYAATAPNKFEYVAPTVGLFGVIPQQSNAQGVNTATYDGYNQTIATQLSADGLSGIYFIPVRNWINPNDTAILTAAMSGSDGAGSGGLTLTDAAISVNSSNLTSPSHYFSFNDVGKTVLCEGAGASGTTLYTTIKGLVGTGAPPYQVHTVGLGLSASTALTAGTCYIGWLGQVWPASTAPGLHPNDYGHQLMARAALATFQPVTAPPLFLNPVVFQGGASVNTPSGGGFNINTSNTKSTNTTGASVNPKLSIYDDGSTALGSIMFYDGTLAAYANAVYAAANEYVELCNGTPYNLATMGCNYKFSLNNGATFLRPLSGTILMSTAGSVQVNSNIAVTGNGWGTTGLTVTSTSGYSQRFRFTITAGASPTANPTFVATFPTAFPIAPLCSGIQVGGTGTNGQIISGTESTSTTGTMTWVGTPVAASTYIIQVDCRL